MLVGLPPTGAPVESLVPKLHQQASSLQDQLRALSEVKLSSLASFLSIRYSEGERRRRASRRKPGDPRDLHPAADRVWEPVAAMIPLAVGEIAIAASLAITGSYAAVAPIHPGAESRHDAGPGPGDRLCTPDGQPLSGSGGRRKQRARGLVDRGPSGGSHALDSASTVAIGFLALLTVPISEIRSSVSPNSW